MGVFHSKPRRPVLLAIDQGTQSTRVCIYDADTLERIFTRQVALKQYTPAPGYTEHDPVEIFESVLHCMKPFATPRFLRKHQVLCIGITNQRETTIAWDKITGKPLHKAIVWLDTRTSKLVEQIKESHGGNGDALRPVTGLPLSTYFSGLKMRWLVENVPEVAKAAQEKRLCLGTVDAWLLYNLTGGASNGGVFVTDVTNASRYSLMDLASLKWSAQMCEELKVPMDALPSIVSSAEPYGAVADGLPLAGTTISGVLGDQHAALLGQRCREGEAKCTYGTGSFLLVNTGAKLCPSQSGLLTTVAFQLGRNSPTQYALEGAVPCAGMAVSWLKENLKMIDDARESETVASTVPNTGGCAFVPALQGLFAPRWRMDARGALVGLSLFTTRAHVVRAVLEGVAHSIREVVDAMAKDARKSLTTLRVDGGMTANKLVMQIQADLLGIPVECPSDAETTVRGAAVAAKIGAGLMSVQDAFKGSSVVSAWVPKTDDDARLRAREHWDKAVEKSLGWER